jgi:hypothetical protein
MSFLPGGLELYKQDGEFVVTVKDEIVLRTRSQKTALHKFKSIRESMEKDFPHRPPSDEDVKAILESVLNDAAIEKSQKRPPKRRTTARGSRTFGG